MPIDDDLTSLEAAGLIRLARRRDDEVKDTSSGLAQFEPELEYLFSHELLRDAVYHNMVRHMRREHHQSVATAIEQLYPDRLDELAPVLAFHFDQADDRERALHYLTLAGDVAFARYANAEAVMHYSRALELASEGTPIEEIARIYGRRGQALEHTGRFAEALDNFVEMRRLADERGQPQLALDALMAQATIRSAPNSAHDAAQAKRLADEALALAEKLGDRAAEATILWNLMMMHSTAGNHPQAIACGERSLAIARELNLRRQLAFTLSDLASHGYIEAGMYGKARAVLEEARPIWVELGDKPMLADNLCGLALSHYTLGEFDEVFEAAAEARQVSESINNLWCQSYSRFVVSDVLVERGQPELAMTMMREAIDMGEQAGFVTAAVGVGSYLGRALGYLGQFEQGIAEARKAVGKARAGMPGWVGWPVSTLARVQVWAGDLAGADATLGEIRGDDEKTLFPIGVEYLLAETELGLVRGDAAGALSFIDDLLGQMRASGARLGLADVLVLRARSLKALNRLDEARTMLAEARQVSEKLGSRRILWKILAMQAEDVAQQAEAKSLRAQARQIVEEIASNIGQDKLRETFLNLPEVRALSA